MRIQSLALAFAATTSFAADLRVDDSNMTGTSDGSALRPYATIQAALSAAGAGDRILVAAGTYAGPVRVEARVLELRGGYPGGTPAAYAANTPGNFTSQDPVANTTTLQGTPADAVVLLIDAGASVLDGFRITGGGGANIDEFRSQGGGVYVELGAPTLSRNTITANDARDATLSSFGGGIYTREADTLIENNTITANYAMRGGGIAVGGGMPVVSGNLIDGNIGTEDHGGGIYAFSPDILIAGNIITRNEIGRDLGYGWGGGIIVFNPGANATITDNLVAENYSPGRGPGVFIDEGANATMDHCLIVNNISRPDVGIGAVYVDGGEGVGSTLTMTHCTIAGHADPDATLGGNGMFVEGSSSAAVENCIFWGNAAKTFFATGDSSFTVRYSTMEDANPGIGNLTADPLFVNAAAGDYHLRSQAGHWVAGGGYALDATTSPAIDAANPASPFALEPSGNGGRANQGRYGNTPEASRTVAPAAMSVGWMVR